MSTDCFVNETNISSMHIEFTIPEIPGHMGDIQSVNCLEVIRLLPFMRTRARNYSLPPKDNLNFLSRSLGVETITERLNSIDQK